MCENSQNARYDTDDVFRSFNRIGLARVTQKRKQNIAKCF